MRGKGRAVAAAIVALSLVLCGCWDRIEIEERSFVIGVAVDFPSDEKKNPDEDSDEEKGKPDGEFRFLATYQIPITSELPGGSGQAQSGGNGGRAYFNIEAIDETMFAVNTLMSTKLQRAPFFEHLKVIIVSEEVARSEQGFANVLDYFLRDQEMRRNVKIMVASGQARDVLNVEPPNERLPAMYLEALGENTKITARMIPETRIGEVHEFLVTERSFTIQRVAAEKDAAIVAGAGVFDAVTNRMVGFINQEEAEGLNFLTGRIEGGMLEILLEDNLASFEIERTNRSIRLVRGLPIPKFVVDVKAEGSLIEMFDRIDLTKRGNFSMIERKIEEEIIRLCEDAIRRQQQELKVDVMGLGALLEQNHPKIWRQVKDDWDRGAHLFSRCDIEVRVHAFMRRNGTVNQTEVRND